MLLSLMIYHTKEAVYNLTMLYFEMLKTMTTINCAHFMSNGYGAQFKNRYNMQNLMLHKEHYNVDADDN